MNLRTLLVCLMWLPACLWADTSATLAGRISDPNGSMIPKATVDVINSETTLKRSTESDSEGLYVRGTGPGGLPESFPNPPKLNTRSNANIAINARKKSTAPMAPLRPLVNLAVCEFAALMVVMQPSLHLLSPAVNGNHYAESGICMPNPILNSLLVTIWSYPC